MPHVTDQALLRARDILRPSAQAGAKFPGPLVCRLENYTIAFPTNEDFLLLREPARLGKPDGLTAAVPEQLRARCLHETSLDVSLYTVKWSCRLAYSNGPSTYSTPSSASFFLRP